MWAQPASQPANLALNRPSQPAQRSPTPPDRLAALAFLPANLVQGSNTAPFLNAPTLVHPLNGHSSHPVQPSQPSQDTVLHPSSPYTQYITLPTPPLSTPNTHCTLIHLSFSLILLAVALSIPPRSPRTPCSPLAASLLLILLAHQTSHQTPSPPRRSTLLLPRDPAAGQSALSDDLPSWPAASR